VAEVTPIDARRLAIAIISIEGEGAESGLLLPIARNLLRAHGRAARPPAEALRLASADIARELGGRTFICVTYGIFDTRTLVYRFARAGSEAILRWRPRPGAEGALAELESAAGMPIGSARTAFEGALAEREVVLFPGDLVVHPTRGAIAAESVEGRELSASRFQGLVRRYGNHEADYFIVKFGQFFEDWTRGAPLRDDACVLAMKLKEQP
jgi:serine phosphatase RsbU (regulator of sigma subunit)